MSTDPRDNDLSPLPEPAGSIEVRTADYLDDKGKVVGYESVEADGYTADQVRDYARPLAAEISRLTAELEEARKDVGRKPLTDAQIEAGRKATFSTSNPFCPCDSKTMRKAVRWAERAHGITDAAMKGKPHGT